MTLEMKCSMMTAFVSFMTILMLPLVFLALKLKVASVISFGNGTTPVSAQSQRTVLITLSLFLSARYSNLE